MLSQSFKSLRSFIYKVLIVPVVCDDGAHKTVDKRNIRAESDFNVNIGLQGQLNFSWVYDNQRRAFQFSAKNPMGNKRMGFGGI